jgi:vacuolar-type H+-ATPase subunit C/Vma6
MELLTFAIDDAYPEAICRGYRMNMLNREHYDALAQVQQGDFKRFLDVNHNTL